MSEEIKKEEPKIEPSNGKDEKKEGVEEKANLPPPTDFKVAEIWIRSGEVMLDAVPNFWVDRCRALGLLELCKDIVKTAKMPEQKNKIIPASGGMMNFARNIFRRKH